MDYLRSARVKNVESGTELVAVEVVEHTARVGVSARRVHSASVVHRILELDADDLCAEVGQNARAGRPCHDPRKIHYTNAFQGVLTHTNRSQAC